MTPLPGINEQVMQLFLRFIERDELLLHQIKQHGKSFSIDNRSWSFQLDDLHEFFITHVSRESACGYRTFRQAIYKSDINTTLATKKASIEIAVNTGKVDQNIYKLVVTLDEGTYNR